MMELFFTTYQVWSFKVGNVIIMWDISEWWHYTVGTIDLIKC